MAAAEPIMAGARFGRWLVLEAAPPKIYSQNGFPRAMWLCLCDCGTERAVQGYSLSNGMSQSCGCTRFDKTPGIDIPKGERACIECGCSLPLSAYSPRRERGGNAVRSTCKECINKLRREARRNCDDAEKERQLQIARQWKHNNFARDAAKKRAWNARNPDKVNQHGRDASARFRKRNPAVANLRSRKWRARKMNAYPVWADEFVIEQFYECCAERNALRTCGVEWHVDHIIPLQSKVVCGLHVHDNLRVIPSFMNLSKGNRYCPDSP
jgi:hypothetical protein